MKKKILKSLPYIIILILLVSTGILLLQKGELKSEMKFRESVPYVELGNYMAFYNDDTASGELTGFVKFENQVDQPKTMRQYIKITALDNDPQYGQLFAATDIIKLYAIPPREFEPVPLLIESIEGDIMVLIDAGENRYGINRKTGQVMLFDSTQDVTTLITDNIEYQNFMLDFLE